MKKSVGAFASGGGLELICGKLVMCAGLLFGIAIATNFESNLFVIFLDIPTLFFIVMLLIGQVIAVSGVKQFVIGFNAVFSKRYYVTRQQRVASVALFKMLSRASIRAGIICALVGLILMLTNLSDPSIIGPYFAMQLISLLYGFLISFFFFEPMAQVLEKRMDGAEATITARPADTSVLSDREVVEALTRLCRQNGITLEELIRAGKISIDKESHEIK